MTTFNANTDVENLPAGITRTGARFTDGSATNVTGGTLTASDVIFETPAMQLNGGTYSLTNCAVNVTTNPAGTNEFRNGTFNAINCQLNFANAGSDAGQIVWGGNGATTVGNLTSLNLTNTLIQRGTGTGALLINGRQWDPANAILTGTVFGQNALAQLRFGTPFTGADFASTQTNTQGGQTYNYRWVAGTSNSGWTPFWNCNILNWTAAEGINYNLNTAGNAEMWILGGILPTDGNISHSTRSTHNAGNTVVTRLLAPWNPQIISSADQSVIADGEVTLRWSSQTDQYAVVPTSYSQAIVPSLSTANRAHSNGDSYAIQIATGSLTGGNQTANIASVAAANRTVEYNTYQFIMFRPDNGSRRTMALTAESNTNSYSPLSSSVQFGSTSVPVSLDPEVTQVINQTAAQSIAGGTGDVASLDHTFLVSKANNLNSVSMPFGYTGNTLNAFGNVTMLSSGSSYNEAGGTTQIPNPTTGLLAGTRFTGLDMGNNTLDLGGQVVNYDLTARTSPITNPRVFTSIQTDTVANNSFNGIAVGGTLTVNAPTDVYLVFNNVTVSGSLTINRGTGTGTIFVQGIQSTTTGVTFGAGVQDAPIRFFTSSLPTSASIITQVWDNTGGTIGTAPLITINGIGSGDTSSGFTGVTDVRIVSFGAGFTSRVTDLTVGADDVNIDLSQLLPVSYPSSALSAASIGFLSTDTGNRVYVSATSYDAANNRLTFSIDGPTVNLSDSLLNDWMQRALKREADYGRVVANNNGEFVFSSGELGFAESFSDRIRFTPGTVNNNSYNFGHLANRTIGQGPSAFSVARTLNLQGGGTTGISVEFQTSPAVFDSAAIDVAIANANLATGDDVRTITQTEGVSLNNTGLRQVNQAVLLA